MLRNYSFVASSAWIRYIVLALVAATLCAFLAMWQNDRRQQRDAEIATIEANYNAAPVALSEVVADTSAGLAAKDEWTKVEVRGKYEPELTVLARNRTVNNQPGFYVIVPFTTVAGDQILVNRGWVPAPSTGSASPDGVPKPPAREATVTGWLRPTEDGSKDDNPDRIIRAIDTERVPGLTSPYKNAFVQAGAEDPAGDAGLSPLPPPSLDPGSHLSYTFQWIAFGIMILIAIVFTIVREKKTRESSPDAPTTYVVVDKEALKHGSKSGSRYGTSLHRTRDSATHRARRPVKDEDAEDAELNQQGL